MALHTALFIGVFLLLLSVCAAQFGVAGKNKQKATTFEEANELAKERFDGVDVDAMGNIVGNLENALGNVGDLGLGDLSKYFEDAMNNPEMMKMMQEMGAGMEDMMSALQDLTPEQLADQMKQAMDMMTSGNIFDGLADNMDEVVKNLEQTGMIPKEKLEEFKSNPQKFIDDVNEAMSQLGEVFSDPSTIEAASKIAKSFSEAALNPEGLLNEINEAMAELSETLSSELSDDVKIEEARLQLLANPELAGGALSSVFSSEEMKEILNDPAKWKESVKKGQGMLLGQAAA